MTMDCVMSFLPMYCTYSCNVYVVMLTILCKLDSVHCRCFQHLFCLQYSVNCAFWNNPTKILKYTHGIPLENILNFWDIVFVL